MQRVIIAFVTCRGSAWTILNFVMDMVSEFIWLYYTVIYRTDMTRMEYVMEVTKFQ